MLCSEPSQEGVEMPNLTDVGESSAASSRGHAFNEKSGLPDMNEHVECPVGFINNEVAPLGDPTMAEQHPSVNRQTNCDQDAPDGREQMNRFLSLLPDDPILLPVRFTDLLNGRYDEIIGSVYGSGVDGRPAPSAPSGASHPVPPPASSLDGLREQNGPSVGFFFGFILFFDESDKEIIRIWVEKSLFDKHVSLWNRGRDIFHEQQHKPAIPSSRALQILIRYSSTAEGRTLVRPGDERTNESLPGSAARAGVATGPCAELPHPNAESKTGAWDHKCILPSAAGEKSQRRDPERILDPPPGKC